MSEEKYIQNVCSHNHKPHRLMHSLVAMVRAPFLWREEDFLPWLLPLALEAQHAQRINSLPWLGPAAADWGDPTLHHPRPPYAHTRPLPITLAPHRPPHIWPFKGSCAALRLLLRQESGGVHLHWMLMTSKC